MLNLFLVFLSCHSLEIEILKAWLVVSSIFIHSGYLHSSSSSPLLLRGAPDTAQKLCRSFRPKRHRHLRVKDLPKDPMWQLERDSNPRPFGQKREESTNESPCPQCSFIGPTVFRGKILQIPRRIW